MPRPSDEPGKGGFWTLDYDYIRQQELSKQAAQQAVASASLSSCPPDRSAWFKEATGATVDAKQTKPKTAVSPVSAEKRSPADLQRQLSRRRRTAELEASKLLDMLIPEEGWDESVKAVASVVDEIYSAVVEQEQRQRQQEESVAVEQSARDGGETLFKGRLFKRTRHDVHVPEPSVASNSRSRRTSPAIRNREPKPYSSMAGTLKIPTPIMATIPHSSHLPTSNRPLQYHQYQPATPAPSSGTNSAK